MKTLRPILKSIAMIVAVLLAIALSLGEYKLLSLMDPTENNSVQVVITLAWHTAFLIVSISAAVSIVNNIFKKYES